MIENRLKNQKMKKSAPGMADDRDKERDNNMRNENGNKKADTKRDQKQDYKQDYKRDGMREKKADWGKDRDRDKNRGKAYSGRNGAKEENAAGRKWDEKKGNGGKGIDGRKIDRTGGNGKRTDERRPDEYRAGGKRTDVKKADGRRDDGRRTDGRGVDGRRTDGRGTDGRGVDGKRADGRRFDDNRADSRWQNDKRADSRKLDERGKDGRRFDDNKADHRNLDDGRKDNRWSKDKGIDSRRLDDRRTDSRRTDRKSDDSRTDSRRSDDSRVDSRKLDGRRTDNRMSDDRRTDSRRFDDSRVDSRKLDGRRTDNRKSDNRRNDGRKSDDRSTDSRRSNDRSTDSRKSDDRSKDSRRSNDKRTEGRGVGDIRSNGNRIEERKNSSSRFDENKSDDKRRGGKSASGTGRQEQWQQENHVNEFGKKRQAESPQISEKRTARKSKSLCPVSARCGGCQLLDIPYEKQLEEKKKKLELLLKPYCKVVSMTGMENPYHYRNKVHAVFGHEKGNAISGVYEANSHVVVPVEHCLIEDQKADEIIGTIRGMLKSFKILTYDEDTGYGLLRHVLIRRGFTTGEIMVVLVTSSPVFPSKNNFVKALRQKHPDITTIIQNVNGRDTSMVLGDKEQVLYGKGYIEDILCGCRFRISSKSFYQINPVQTERLYEIAMNAAQLTGTEIVIDAYCGIGTIAIVASQKAGKVIGVELNRDAVKDAVQNAKVNGCKNIEFYCNDAGKFMVNMAQAGESADVVFMDPPRSGSTEEFIEAVAVMKPKRVVYVSCGPDSLVRDLGVFEKNGYRAEKAWGVDLFAFTEHVETACLLVRKP